MSANYINIGLPFFDDINKQVSKKPFFTNYLVEWLSASNRFLPFQVNVGEMSGVKDFDLINSVTGETIDYIDYFNDNVIETEVDGEYYYTHLGIVDVNVANGRYYFYLNGGGGQEWWSEEFIMCDGGAEEEYEYLLVSVDDYLLLDSTDKLKIG